jgi:CubicO group peptidase (beta-lactamase class C family)
MRSGFFRGCVCLLGCLLVAPAVESNAPIVQTPVWMALVDAMAKKTLERPVLGISIALANNDRVVFARGYGFADVARSVPVTGETVFHIASISKNIEAGLLLQLAGQGKLSLDDEVTRFILDAPVHGKQVTVRQLLNHTSGIPSYTSLPDAEKNEQLDLSHQQVLDLIRSAMPDFDPGTSWRYNNSGFYLAGMIAENVTHQPYATLLRDRIFTPLQMQASSLCDGSVPVPNLASGSEVVNGKLVPAAPMSWKLPFAGGGVCSTASDLLTWQMALNKGRVDSKHSLTAMRTPTALADGTSIDYGLGTRIGLLEGHPVFGATGSGGGFTTALETFPDEKLSIAVLINTASDGATTGLAGAIARSVLGLADVVLRDIPPPAAELACIPGVYDSDEGAVEVSNESGKLHFRIPGAGGATGVIKRQGAYSYAIDENRRVRFRCEPGHSRWAEVYSGGLMVDAKRAPTAP